MSSRLRFDSPEAYQAWLAGRTKRKKQTVARVVPTEEQEQIRLMDWVRLHEYQHPELADLHHVPNGGFRRKSEAARLARMGVLPGVMDLHLPHARRGAHSLYVEMKALDGTPSEWQIIRAISFVTAGNMVVFAWGWEEAWKYLCWYLDNE